METQAGKGQILVELILVATLMLAVFGFALMATDSQRTELKKNFIGYDGGKNGVWKNQSRFRNRARDEAEQLVEPNQR